MTVIPAQHTDASVWGPTIGDFNHHRFLRDTYKPCRVPLLRRRDGILPKVSLSKAGKWTEPRNNLPMTLSMPTPKGEVQVEIVPRRKGGTWRSLIFTASIRETSTDSNAASQEMGRDVVVLFGLLSAFDTKMGNALIQGVSRSETRTSITKARISDAQLQSWDNSTRRLDTSTVDFLTSLTNPAECKIRDGYEDRASRSPHEFL
ncbi:hypothetical protein F5X99DRAFT_424977 [Biscogniauxia marginata]|nr:hypothetical protein F5X99DRAFT_424977 [Biscogniauxia marginata]